MGYHFVRYTILYVINYKTSLDTNKVVKDLIIGPNVDITHLSGKFCDNCRESISNQFLWDMTLIYKLKKKSHLLTMGKETRKITKYRSLGNMVN